MPVEIAAQVDDREPNPNFANTELLNNKVQTPLVIHMTAMMIVRSLERHLSSLAIEVQCKFSSWVKYEVTESQHFSDQNCGAMPTQTVSFIWGKDMPCDIRVSRYSCRGFLMSSTENLQYFCVLPRLYLFLLYLYEFHFKLLSIRDSLPLQSVS